ncbi:hypothetical protein GCM10027066_33720 [Dyella jejuensis]
MLARAIDSKQAIVSGIVGQLQSVFDCSACETDPDYQQALQAARATLVQQLQLGLSKGYDLPVIVQHDVASTARPGESEVCMQIPAPLRTYPALPSVVEQTAVASFDPPNGLRQLSLWTYRLGLAHEFAPQDTLRVTTEFNLQRGVSRRQIPASGPDLFSAMAQYMAVAEKLRKLLSVPPEPKSGERAFYVNASQTFADLVAAVAKQWRIRPPHKSASLPENDFVAGISHTFGLRVAYSKSRQAIESVSLTREPPTAGAEKEWPELEVLLEDGRRVPFLAQTPDPSSLAAVYVPANGSEVPAFARQTFQLAWSGLNVSTFQNARSRMSIVRNESLLYDPLCPENATPRTNPVFLLRTAEEVAGNSVAPLIERNDAQDMEGANLHEALESAFQSLFPSDSLLATAPVTCQLDYCYELAFGDGLPDGNAPGRVRMPVVFYPDKPLPGMARALANAGQEWIDSYQPAHEGAGWILNIVLHSGLEPAMHPLIKADVFYRIEEQPPRTHAGARVQ